MFAGGGALLMLYAVLSNRMIGMDLPGADMGIGLRGITACGGGQCHTVDQHTTMGTVSFVVGLLCVASIGAAVYLDRVKDDDRLWRLVGSATCLWLLTVATWYFTIPSASFLSMGSGFYAAIIGVSFVSGASFRGESNWGGLERVRMREEDIEAKLAAFSQSPDPSGQSAAFSEPERRSEEFSEPPADEEPVELRFIASRLEIADDGVRATLADGGERHFLFESIGQVVARQLPRELGRGPATLLDLVKRDEQREPIRVLPETSVNYAFLPQGAREDNCENVRALVQLVRALHPDVRMDEGSLRFAEGAARPLPFQSLEHFWEYDSRYTGATPGRAQP